MAKEDISAHAIGDGSGNAALSGATAAQKIEEAIEAVASAHAGLGLSAEAFASADASARYQAVRAVSVLNTPELVSLIVRLAKASP